MIRSGMETTLRAVLYSGFFWKREEFSRVDTSSAGLPSHVSGFHLSMKMNGRGYLCTPARTQALGEDWTWLWYVYVLEYISCDV